MVGWYDNTTCLFLAHLTARRVCSFKKKIKLTAGKQADHEDGATGPLAGRALSPETATATTAMLPTRHQAVMVRVCASVASLCVGVVGCVEYGGDFFF